MQEQIETFGMMLIKGVIAPAFLALLTWAAAKLGAWIHSKVRNEAAAGVLDRLNQLTFHVVQEIEQTVVSTLSNKADTSALRAARDQALVTLKSHLGDKGLRELMAVLGLKDDDAVVKLLLSYIESAVMTMKVSNPPVTTTVEHIDDLGHTTKTVTIIQPNISPAAASIVNTQGATP